MNAQHCAFQESRSTGESRHARIQTTAKERAELNFTYFLMLLIGLLQPLAIERMLIEITYLARNADLLLGSIRSPMGLAFPTLEKPCFLHKDTQPEPVTIRRSFFGLSGRLNAPFCQVRCHLALVIASSSSEVLVHYADELNQAYC